MPKTKTPKQPKKGDASVKRTLTPKQQKFADLYLELGNAMLAFQGAGIEPSYEAPKSGYYVYFLLCAVADAKALCYG